MDEVKMMNEKVMDMEPEVYDEAEVYEGLYEDGGYREMESYGTGVLGSEELLTDEDEFLSGTLSVGTSKDDPLSIVGKIDDGVLIGIPVASLIITILVFIFVVEKRKAPRNGFMRWLREYLNFRSILISGIIKFVYLFSAVLLTICSFVVMTQGGDDRMLEAILIGLAILVFGNILLRIITELIMIMIGLWKNTSDMRAVLVKDDEKPVEKEPKKTEGQGMSKEKQVIEKGKMEELNVDKVVEKTILAEEATAEQPQVEERETVTQVEVGEAQPQVGVEESSTQVGAGELGPMIEDSDMK